MHRPGLPLIYAVSGGVVTVDGQRVAGLSVAMLGGDEPSPGVPSSDDTPGDYGSATATSDRGL